MIGYTLILIRLLIIIASLILNLVYSVLNKPKVLSALGFKLYNCSNGNISIYFYSSIKINYLILSNWKL